MTMPYPTAALDAIEEVPLPPRREVDRRHSPGAYAVISPALKRPVEPRSRTSVCGDPGARVSSYFAALVIAAGLMFVWAGLCLT